MNRFQYLKKIKNNDKFIGMELMTSHVEFKKNNPTTMFSPINDIMDIFYLSLLVGLKIDKKLDINDSNYVKGDMTPNWTDNLTESKDILIALYVSHMIEKQDKNYSNKPEVQKILNKKLGKNPTRSISDEGMIDIHGYAFGGYLEILNQLNNKYPNDLLAFFSVINNLIKDQ
tara:strand:+ start:23 stop:538 length:516 start_codon:yes stop_codon:yes gene_type:complete